MRTMTRYAAAGALVAGVLAGCGGLTKSHTEFRAGPAVEVSVSPKSATMQVGSTQQLSASARDNKGLTVEDAQFTWSVFSPAVAAVDANGTVTAVGPGTTSVTAVHNGMQARAEVTVTAGAVEASFDRDIKPIAALACSCHNAGGTAASTGSMADLGNITGKGWVVAGSPQASKYLTVGAGGGGHPGGDAWGANQQKVSNWIEEGAKP